MAQKSSMEATAFNPERYDEESEKASQSVLLTSKELTVLSDILRRVPMGNIFAESPQFQTAAEKIEDAKWKSYDLMFKDRADGVE